MSSRLRRAPRAKKAVYDFTMISNCNYTANMLLVSRAKRDLRNEMRIILNSISDQERNRQGQKVFQKLRSSFQYLESNRVSIYLSIDNEINTIPILRDMFASKKEVFIPRYSGKEMHMLKLFSMEDYDRMPSTKWNIKQPAEPDKRPNALETGGLDLLIVPGVAFTKDGDRLGHGMGYYDKYLKLCVQSQRRKPHLIALAFNEQIRKEIPITELDYKIDMVLTEKDT